MRLGIKEIEQILPHRHPFLLVDYIEEMEPGVSAVGYKCVTFHEDFFRLGRAGRLAQASASVVCRDGAGRSRCDSFFRRE